MEKKKINISIAFYNSKFDINRNTIFEWSVRNWVKNIHLWHREYSFWMGEMREILKILHGISRVKNYSVRRPFGSLKEIVFYFKNQLLLNLFKYIPGLGFPQHDPVYGHLLPCGNITPKISIVIVCRYHKL